MPMYFAGLIFTDWIRVLCCLQYAEVLETNWASLMFIVCLSLVRPGIHCLLTPTPRDMIAH